MAQIGFKFDPARCQGCRACVVACKQEMNTPDGVSYRHVLERWSGSYPSPKRGFISMACFHCEHPACLKACPTSPDKTNYDNPSNTIRKYSPYGIVLINQETCIGCKRCAAACPYGAPRFNPYTEKMEKCTLCAHRILADGSYTTLRSSPSGTWKPACVTTCPSKALDWENPVANTGDLPGTLAKRDYTKPSVTISWSFGSSW